MIRRTVAITTVIAALLLSACEFQEQADQKSGDQHFKTARFVQLDGATQRGKY